METYVYPNYRTRTRHGILGVDKQITLVSRPCIFTSYHNACHTSAINQAYLLRPENAQLQDEAMQVGNKMVALEEKHASLEKKHKSLEKKYERVELDNKRHRIEA